MPKNVMQTALIVALVAAALAGTAASQAGPVSGGTTARLCASDSQSTPATGTVTASITQLEWLGGTWIGTSGSNTFEERWTPPAGGVMFAVARTIRNGSMNAFEFLCIVERNGALVYQAMPNGRQPATDFRLTKIQPNSVTFENPAHDFPKMIRYTLGTDGTLEAVVSGTESQKPLTFRFRKE